MSHYKYKVLEKDFLGNLRSVSTSYGNVLYSLNYKLNKWVEAPIGGCLVFKTLKEAKSFNNVWSSSFVIYACEVLENVKLPKYRSTCFPSSIERTWKNEKEYGILWPKGTQAYKKVKLLYECK